MSPETSDNGAPTPGQSTPRPDPTVLTTEQLLRAIASERDYVNGQIAILEERLRGIDEATKLRLGSVDTLSHKIDATVGRLEDLTNEKFGSVQTQFRERDTRSERESRDNKVAVDAAFAAQKEAAAKQDEGNQKAIDKSEAATAEKINKLNELFSTTINALDDKLDDLKDRVRGMESTKIGATENRTGVYATIAIAVTLALFGMAVISFFALRGTP